MERKNLVCWDCAEVRLVIYAEDDHDKCPRLPEYLVCSVCGEVMTEVPERQDQAEDWPRVHAPKGWTHPRGA